MILLSTKSLFSNIEGPQGQDTSSSSFVGVRHFQPTLAHPPFTIYYPAATTSTKEQKRSVGWFHENGFVFYILGYLHMTSKYTRHDTLLFRWFLTPFIHIISLLFPARWIKLANVYENVPLDTTTTTTTTTTTEKEEQYPVIFFSHGLTGTGEENSALLVAWAKRGYIVISIHHTDGSSCCVRSCTGTDSSSSRPTITSHPQKLYYDVPPPYTNYDTTYRPKQVKQRANEIWKVYDYLVQEQQDGTKTSSDSSNNGKEEKGKEQILNYLPEDISSRMNFNKVIAVGYSYGAATVALAALYKPNVLKGIIFLDGWFHIDVEESAGIEFNFPQEVFDSLSATTAATTTMDSKKSGDDNDNGTSNNNVLKDIPSLFINSEQFQGYTKLWKATTALIGNNQGDSASGTTKHQSYVLQGTGHYNFIDICFWIPNFVAKRLKPVVGIADPMKVYKDLVNKTSEFMEGLYNNDDM